MRRGLPALLLSLAAGLGCGALDISVGGSRTLVLSEAQVAARSRPVFVSGRSLAGVPLEDLLPVMTDADALTLVAGGAVRRVADPALAERLGEIVVAPAAAGGLSLVLPADLGEAATGLSAVDVSGTPLERRTLEVWASWEGVPELKAIVAGYAALHSLDIKVVDVPDTRARTLTVVRGGGRPADLVMVQTDHLPDLVGARALQPLGSLATAPLAASGWSAFTTRDGRRWAVPFSRDVQLVFYNPALVAVPRRGWDLDEMERLAAPLAARGLVPMAWNAYSAYWLLPFQLGFGKEEIVRADGSMLVDDEPTARAVAYLGGLVRRGLLAVVERDAMVGLFAAGKAGLILSGSYSIPELRAARLDFGVASFPRAADGRPLASLLDYKGFAVSRTTQNPLLARRLAQYLARPDVQLSFARAVEKLPASEGATAAYLAASPYGPVLAESLATATLIPPEPVYGTYRNAMWNLLRLVFAGEMSASEALRVGQRSVDGAAGSAHGGSR